MKLKLKYSIGLIFLLMLIWFSIDIQNLEKHNATLKTENFNTTEYVARFWNDSLSSCIAKATKIEDLYQLLNENPQLAYEKQGKKLGISKTYYFFIKASGSILKIEDEFIILSINDKTEVKIATHFIYGNAVREASGKVNISEFLNMTDFNSVSVAINKLVKENVVKPLRKSAAVGQKIQIVGAMEINSEKVDLSEVRIIPVSFEITDGKSE